MTDLTRRSVLCGLMLAPLAWGTAPAASAGPVLAIGGALQDGNAAIWSRLTELASGSGAGFVVLSPGSEDPEASARGIAALLARHGAAAAAVTAQASPDRVLALLREAGGVFFGGGDQSKIVAALAPDGRPTPLLDAIRALHARGGVIAGTSAGAAVLSEWMFTGGEPLAVLAGRAGTVHAGGLGFVRSGMLIDQHFIKRGRVGRLLPTLQRLAIPIGLGVEEDSAALIRGDSVEVLGARGVLVIDLRGSAGDAQASPSRPFGIRGAALSWLEAGDRFDLDSGSVTPSATKRAARVVGRSNPDWRPYHRDGPPIADMLADGAIVGAMQRLVDSDAAETPEVRGLAFDAGALAPPALDAQAAAAGQPIDPAAAASTSLGFAWRLSRGPDTAAWSAGDRYTIARVLLEVQPVRMARPLFTPLN